MKWQVAVALFGAQILATWPAQASDLPDRKSGASDHAIIRAAPVESVTSKNTSPSNDTASVNAWVATTQVVPAAVAADVPLPLRKAEPHWPKLLPDRRLEADAPAKAGFWSDQEIATANARCTALLKGIDAVVVPQASMRDGVCGAPAPVQLVSVGSNPQVSLSPPPTLTCDMVVALAGWLKNDLQPLSRQHFGEPITRIETMSSYACRNAYGRAKSRLSEHGRANALDIGAFVTSTGASTVVLADWGVTNRDLTAQATAAKADEERKTADTKAAAGADNQAPARPQVAGQSPPASPPAGNGSAAPSGNASESSAFASAASGLPARALGSIIDGIPSALRLPDGRDGFAYSGMNRLGGPKATAAKASGPESAGTTSAERKERFLKAAHASACKIFGTVLGPEANNAHKNHFHVDMAERASGPFCE